MSLRIETERLILRPTLIGDLDDLFEYQSNPEIVRYIPWPPRTVAQVEEAALKTIETGKFNLLETNDYIVLVWELKDTGKVIEPCLQWALETGQDSGVWGGLSEEERRAMGHSAPAASINYF